MEYSELSDYPIHSGRITEWIPAAEEGGWVQDSRKLSPNHQAHAQDIARCGEDPEHNWIGTVFRIYGEYNAEAFGQAMTMWIRRHEALHTTAIRTEGSEVFERMTLRADAVTVDERRVEGDVGSQFVHAQLNHYFAETLSALTWPHLTFATVEPTEDVLQEVSDARGNRWFTVIFAADHCVMDAYTQLFAIQEFTELYNSQVEKRLPELPECGSYVDFSDEESTMADEIDGEHEVVRAWQDFFTHCSQETPAAPRFPLPHSGAAAVAESTVDAATQLQSADAGERTNKSNSQRAEKHPERRVEQCTETRWLLNAEEAEAFSARCKKEMGGSQSNGLLAAMKIAVNRLTEEDTVRYVMPMHTRTRADMALAAGWFVGLMPVEDPLGDAHTFGEAMANTTAAVKRYRKAVSAPFNSLQPHLKGDSAPKFVVSYVDTRFVPGADSWTEHDRALRSPCVSDEEVYFWILRTHSGINLSTRYPANSLAESSIAAFLDEYKNVLKSVVSQGDFDFGGVLQ